MPDLPGKKAPEPKPERAGKKKQGKQPGAPGAHLAWTADPDKTEPLFPQGPCSCGNDLADAADLGVAASHQVIDTPVVTATVTQYDEHAVACACGRVHVAAPPPGAGQDGTVTYGPNVQAWAIFLLVMHHVPVERCADVIGTLTGARPSDGVRLLTARPRRESRARGRPADPGAGHHRVGAVRGRQLGRARPAPVENPAEDLRPPPLGEGHPRPVRHPRLPRHRPQARPACHGHHP